MMKGTRVWGVVRPQLVVKILVPASNLPQA